MRQYHNNQIINNNNINMINDNKKNGDFNKIISVKEKTYVSLCWYLHFIFTLFLTWLKKTVLIRQ